MFYKVEDPNPRTYQYARKDLAFAEFAKTVCPDCGRELATARYDGPHCMIAEGGPRYPDYLPYGYVGGPMLILSRRAADLFLENGITGIGAVEPVRVV